ncbi:hypothetical protein SDC9_62242 [bioreactor metagenome]|uniref:Uncharacterized protein n=1 Tax=bioreactor metagenome TaxID=1076179 RepID=A0A644XJ88_9ZZZZ
MAEGEEIPVRPVRFSLRQNGTSRVPSARGGGSAAAVSAAAAAAVSAAVAKVVAAEAVSAAAAQDQNDNDDEPQAGAVAIPRVKAHGFVTSLKVFEIIYAPVNQWETWPSKNFKHSRIAGGITGYV